ncbi:hypothetical protein J6590_056510 [Homalodisca vitripennis]|nr:hypothetical protein J6590_056510 [Homalodisca vitripennis]
MHTVRSQYLCIVTGSICPHVNDEGRVWGNSPKKAAVRNPAAAVHNCMVSRMTAVAEGLPQIMFLLQTLALPQPPAVLTFDSSLRLCCFE